MNTLPKIRISVLTYRKKRSFIVKNFPFYIGSGRSENILHISGEGIKEKEYLVKISGSHLLIYLNKNNRFVIEERLNLTANSSCELFVGSYKIIIAVLSNNVSRSSSNKKKYESDYLKTDDYDLSRELTKWNWGAFLLNWIWGLGNRTYIALLSLIPFLGLIMAIVLGAKGNEWAWKNKDWYNIEQFKNTQRKWKIAGFTVWGVELFIVILIMVIVSINVSSASSVASNRNAVVGDLTNLASMAQQYYRKPYALGGGERSFSGWAIPSALKSNYNGDYYAMVEDQSVTFIGTGTETGNDDRNFVKVEMKIAPDSITFTRIIN